MAYCNSNKVKVAVSIWEPDTFKIPDFDSRVNRKAIPAPLNAELHWDVVFEKK